MNRSETQSVPKLAPAFQVIRRHLFIGRWIGLTSAIDKTSKMIIAFLSGFSWLHFFDSHFHKQMHHGFAPSASEELLGGGHFAPLKVVETWFLVQRVSDLISFLRSRSAHGNEPFYLFWGRCTLERNWRSGSLIQCASCTFWDGLTDAVSGKQEQKAHVTEFLIKNALRQSSAPSILMWAFNCWGLPWLDDVRA